MEGRSQPAPRDVLLYRIQEHNQARGVVLLRMDTLFEEKLDPDYTSQDEINDLMGIYNYSAGIRTDAAWINELNSSGLTDEQILGIWNAKDEEERSLPEANGGFEG